MIVNLKRLSIKIVYFVTSKFFSLKLHLNINFLYCRNYLILVYFEYFFLFFTKVKGYTGHLVPPAFLIRLGRRTYAAVFNFIAGCDPADDHVGPVVDVSPEPFHGLILSLLYRFKDVLIQQFVPHYAIVAVDIDTLQRLDWHDISRQCRVFRPIASAGH